MDIKTTSPKQYAEWLLSQGVLPEDLHERLAHDTLRALSKQLDTLGVEPEFADFKKQIDHVLAADAIRKALS